MRDGEVIRPLKPLITFSTPVFNSQGDRVGSLVLDFLGRIMIEDIKGAATSSGAPMVVDAQGYWIVGPTREDEWGFVLPGRQDLKFSALYPEAWETMTTRSSGQVRVDAGLFTYTTIFPLMEGKRTSAGQARDRYFDTGLIRGRAYSWKLISFISHKELSAHSNALLKALLPLFLGLAAIAGVFGALLAFASERARAAEEAFRFQVSHDPLTGVWNRSGILELLRREMSRAQREDSFMSLALADIQDFKSINRELGEARANEVLSAVSRAICDSIREYDSAGRYAADQFLIGLPGCDKNEALIVLDRIKAGLEALNEIGYPEGVDVKVSIGVTSTKIRDNTTLDQLIQDSEADLKATRAKGAMD
jgi:diguanylate cyclase (GGDEF)-like protein